MGTGQVALPSLFAGWLSSELHKRLSKLHPVATAPLWDLLPGDASL